MNQERMKVEMLVETVKEVVCRGWCEVQIISRTTQVVRIVRQALIGTVSVCMQLAKGLAVFRAGDRLCVASLDLKGLGTMIG